LNNKDSYKEKAKQCRLTNPEKYKEYDKQRRLDNPEYFREKAKQHILAKKDGLHHVYLLPEETKKSPLGYVGITDCLYSRISQHKSDGNNPSNNKIIKSFTSRKEAEGLEEAFHILGYGGEDPRKKRIRLGTV